MIFALIGQRGKKKREREGWTGKMGRKMHVADKSFLCMFRVVLGTIFIGTKDVFEKVVIIKN